MSKIQGRTAPVPRTLGARAGAPIRGLSREVIFNGAFYGQQSAGSIRVVNVLTGQNAYSISIDHLPPDFREPAHLMMRALSRNGHWLFVERVVDSETASGALVHLPSGHVETSGFEDTGLWNAMEFGGDGVSFSVTRTHSELVEGRRSGRPAFTAFALESGRIARRQDVVLEHEVGIERQYTLIPGSERFVCFPVLPTQAPPVLRSLSNSPTRDRLAVSTAFQYLAIAAQGNLVYSRVDMSPTGKFILARHDVVRSDIVYGSGVDVIRSSNNQRVATLTLAEQAFQIAMSPDDRLIAFETQDGIEIRDVAFASSTLFQIPPFLDREDHLRQLFFADGTTLITVDARGNAIRWALPIPVVPPRPELRVVR